MAHNCLGTRRTFRQHRRMQLSQRRQHHPSENRRNFSNLSLHELPVRTSTSTSTSQYLAPVPAETDVAKLSHSPSSTLESSPAISNLDFSETPDYYMPRGFSHGQPSRAFPSRSASTQPHTNSLQSPDHYQGSGQASSWYPPNNAAAHLTSQPRFQPPFHKRNSSDSTATTAAPQSPYTPVSAASHPYIVDTDSQAYLPQHLEHFDQHAVSSVTSYPKTVPASHPPLSDALFFSPQFQNFSQQYGNDQLMWERAMMSQMMTQPQHGDRQQNYNMSHPSNTSRASANALMSTRSRAAAERNKLPHLDRTMSDIYQDELYNPAEPAVPAPISKPSTPTVKIEGQQASPRNNVFSERLLAASQGHISARSSPPTAAVAREKSPFRPNSQYAGETYSPSAASAPRLGSAAQMREHEKAKAAATAIAQHSQPRAVENTKTVSPKEVSLEYEAEDENDAQHALMPPMHQNTQTQQPPRLKQELTQPEQQAYDAMEQLRRESSSAMSSGQASLRRNGVQQIPQQYPFIAAQRRQNSNAHRTQESIPHFSQHSLSMESTKSEPQSDHSSLGSQPRSPESAIQRPAHTTADTGTYTCTYHGCTQRFETPAKLQRHKRDGHRQGTPSSAGGDSRSTQAGPHRCERINPSTGKPCNSVFSRPYDLTRHEDTIHNARKQKVRCQLCTEEKTFSRNDALTRHMRVVHPEVDFPGKIKRGRA